MSTANKTGIRAPQIKLTPYDMVVGLLQTTALVAALTFLAMVAIWLSNRLPAPVSRKIEMMPAGDGGFEDGAPDETPNVESPEDAVPDPSVSNEESDVTEIEEVLEQVLEVAENASVIEAPRESNAAESSGVPGSADGTGGRPLGSGGPGRGGAKREQGWIVEFADKGDAESYAAQLDFFGIELGLLLKEESRLYYLSKVAQARPTVREVRTGEGEKRLFLNWQDGSQDRVKADIELFAKAQIDAADGVIMHFYPSDLEQSLAQLEVDYNNQQPSAIRRTYFQVKRQGSGYEFTVSRQILK